jgi:hypothetical protein
LERTGVRAAVLNAVEQLARGYGMESERTRQDLGIAETQLRDYQARVGQPFPHAGYLDQLAALRDCLKSGLSGGEPKDNEPTVAELAERIKALRGANTVEATPERSSKRKVAAEVPRRDRPQAFRPAVRPLPHLVIRFSAVVPCAVRGRVTLVGLDAGRRDGRGARPRQARRPVRRIQRVACWQARAVAGRRGA